MSRSAGTYTAPSNSFNPAVEGAEAEEGDWNELLDDLEAALTESTFTAGLGATANALVVTDGTSGKKLKNLATGTEGYVLSVVAGVPAWAVAGSGDMLAANNLDDVADVPTAATNLGLGTGDTPQFTGVNIGAATDTTITRGAAGLIEVEGVRVVTVSATQTLTNKTLTAPTIAGATVTGAVDAGGADSFELPNSAAPTVNADGEIAVDTTVADFAAGVIKYYAGAEMGVVAMPVAQFGTPSNGAVPTYNSTNDQFEMAVPAGAGDVVGPGSSVEAQVALWNSTSGTALRAVSLGLLPALNMSLAASVGSSALTIALKDAGGSDAAAASPIVVGFRSATAATGTITMRTVTAASSLVISSGSTMGAASGVAFRLWIVLFDDAGTLRLGAINCRVGGASPTRLAQLLDNALASSTAEGGAGAADTAAVFYTGTAVTTKPYRILGYMDWASGLTAAGTWDAGPTTIQIFGPGVKRPGEPVQTVYSLTTSSSSTTSTTFVATTTFVNLTPTSAANIVHARAIGFTQAITGATQARVRLSRGSTAATNLFGTETIVGEIICTLGLEGLDAPGTTSSTDYYVQHRRTGAGGSAEWGGGTTPSMIATELMG